MKGHDTMWWPRAAAMASSVEAGNVVEGEAVIAEVGHVGHPHVVGARYEHEETQ